MYNSSVADASLVGLNLRSTVFEVEGYSTQALSTVQAALELGYNQLVIDAYYSRANRRWQLCPSPFPKDATSSSGLYYQMPNPWNSSVERVTCQTNVTFDSLYQTISHYVTKSDTNLAVNVISIKFMLNELKEENEASNLAQFSNSVAGDDILGQNLSRVFPNRLYTPSDLTHDQDAQEVTKIGQFNGSAVFPSMRTVLLTQFKRVIASYSNSTLSPTRDYSEVIDPNLLFREINSSQSLLRWDDDGIGAKLFSACSQLNHSHDIFQDLKPFQDMYTGMFPSLQDSQTNNFGNDSIRIIAQCGITPVINRQLHNIDDLVAPTENAFWSWAPGEPFTQNNSRSNADQAVALQCALLTDEGLRVGNCYESFPVLCQAPDDSFNWTISQNSSDYFHAQDACTGTSNVGVPRSALESVSAQLAVLQSSKHFPVWVDLNSVAVQGCWVSGGPFARCPYYTKSLNRNGVALLSVAACVSFLLLVLMLLLSFRRVSLRRNQFMWRRARKYFSDYEGVPA